MKRGSSRWHCAKWSNGCHAERGLEPSQCERRDHPHEPERFCPAQSDGQPIGVVGILRDMRELNKARAYAESLIKERAGPVFVSDLEGKILQANDAVFALLGFRPDELIEQSLSHIISPAETREFLAALREVVERGVTANARLNPRSASGEVIPRPSTLSAA